MYVECELLYSRYVLPGENPANFASSFTLAAPGSGCLKTMTSQYASIMRIESGKG